MNTINRVDAFLSPLLFSSPYPTSTTSSPSKAELPIPPPSPRLSNLPPTPRKRRPTSRKRPAPKATTSSIKLPPPSTPFLLRMALALWSILLSFWTSLVGETRAERKKRHFRRRVGPPRERNLLGAAARAGGGGVSSDDGSGSDGDVAGGSSADEAEGEVFPDPVTRAPVEESHLVDEPDDAEFAVSDTPSLASSKPDGPDSTFTFRLRSAEKRDPVAIRPTTPPATDEKASKAFQPRPSPPSILSNPLKTRSHTRTASSARLLPNPMATSLLDPSVPAISASQTHMAVPATSVPTFHSRLHQTPFHHQKTLILDLDETLIHSTSRPLSYAASAGGGLLGLSFGGLLGPRSSRKEGHTVEVVLNGRSTTYHVYKRPYVDHFLKKVASWYTLVIFTASMPEYADPVIDWLDGGRGLFARKLYREHCHLQPNGSYVKDLALVEADLSRVCFMDNSPISYSWNKANALPIEGWTSDPNDEALLQSIPVLDSLRFVNDVRHILGIRGFS